MRRRIEPVLKTLAILFILLIFLSVPVIGSSWKLWSSLDKSQYSADSYGEASIALQNTGTTMIHIKEILITFDWMEGYPEHPYAYMERFITSLTEKAHYIAYSICQIRFITSCTV